MQAEIDPILALGYERFLPPPAPLSKEPRLRPLHREVFIPVQMMHAPDAAHSAMNGGRGDLVGIQDLITFLYDLMGEEIPIVPLTEPVGFFSRMRRAFRMAR